MSLKILLLPLLFTYTLLAQNIEHKGYSYKTTTSPTTNKVWLDRNIGASRVCKSIDDKECFGDYFQWGRNSDGHEKLSSPTRTAQVKDFTQMPNEFIEARENNEYDWANKIDTKGITRQKNWTTTDASNVCPKDFRVPTIEELQNEKTILNKLGAYNSFLKLPEAGFRHFRDGVLQDSATFVWSSTHTDTFSFYMVFSESNAIKLDNFRTLGASVRCIKN